MSKKPTYEELLKRVKQLEKNFAESKRVAKDLEQEKKFSENGNFPAYERYLKHVKFLSST